MSTVKSSVPAASSFIEAGESMKDPGRFFRNNFTNSLQLMETAVQAGVRKLVFSSTAAVYQSSEEPLTEESPLGPTNVYGHTKLMTEQALEWYRSIFGLHFAALRYFNACGALPGRGEAHQPESHLIPRVLQIALGQAESANIFGTDYPTPDGTCIRDYIHVMDLAAGHVAALEKLDEIGRPVNTWNLGTGKSASVLQVLAAFSAAVGRDLPYRVMARRPGDVPTSYADPHLAEIELDWRADRTLDQMCADTWRWQSQNPTGYPDA